MAINFDEYPMGSIWEGLTQPEKDKVIRLVNTRFYQFGYQTTDADLPENVIGAMVIYTRHVAELDASSEDLVLPDVVLNMINPIDGDIKTGSLSPIAIGSSGPAANISDFYTKTQSDARYATQTSLSDVVRTPQIADVVRTSQISDVVRTPQIANFVNNTTFNTSISEIDERLDTIQGVNRSLYPDGFERRPDFAQNSVAPDDSRIYLMAATPSETNIANFNTSGDHGWLRRTLATANLGLGSGAGLSYIVVTDERLEITGFVSGGSSTFIRTGLVIPGFTVWHIETAANIGGATLTGRVADKFDPVGLVDDVMIDWDRFRKPDSIEHLTADLSLDSDTVATISDDRISPTSIYSKNNFNTTSDVVSEVPNGTITATLTTYTPNRDGNIRAGIVLTDSDATQEHNSRKILSWRMKILATGRSTSGVNSEFLKVGRSSSGFTSIIRTRTTTSDLRYVTHDDTELAPRFDFMVGDEISTIAQINVINGANASLTISVIVNRNGTVMTHTYNPYNIARLNMDFRRFEFEFGAANGYPTIEADNISVVTYKDTVTDVLTSSELLSRLTSFGQNTETRKALGFYSVDDINYYTLQNKRVMVLDDDLPTNGKFNVIADDDKFTTESRSLTVKALAVDSDNNPTFVATIQLPTNYEEFSTVRVAARGLPDNSTATNSDKRSITSRDYPISLLSDPNVVTLELGGGSLRSSVASTWQNEFHWDRATRTFSIPTGAFSPVGFVFCELTR